MTERKLQSGIKNRSPFVSLPSRDLELLGWVKGDKIIIDTDIKKKKINLCKEKQ